MINILPELAQWDSFYVIVGSAAGALIGLQFVVMTLIAARPPLHAEAASAAFASPTIVHFATVLLLALLFHAPWQSISIVSSLFGFLGFIGVAYIVAVIHRIRKQAAYKPGFEDWVFHVCLPFVAYSMLASSFFAALSHPREAFFCVAAAVTILLFTGIHNAWDGVTYHVLDPKANVTDN